jgi:3-phenylpropionate/cinnamic acid dioxygenase small subunit
VSDGGLATRVQWLEDERAILSVLYRYSQAIDEMTLEAKAEWVDLFTEDGVFAWKPGPTDDWVFRLEGRAALTDFMAGIGFAEPDQHENHLTVNPRVVSIESDRATALSYYVVLRGSSDDVWVNTTGRYTDELVRSSDGRWRIRERLAVADFTHAATSPLAEARRAVYGSDSTR